MFIILYLLNEIYWHVITDIWKDDKREIKMITIKFKFLDRSNLIGILISSIVDEKKRNLLSCHSEFQGAISHRKSTFLNDSISWKMKNLILICRRKFSIYLVWIADYLCTILPSSVFLMRLEKDSILTGITFGTIFS